MFTFDLEGSGSSQSQRECAGINRSEWCVCVCVIYKWVIDVVPETLRWVRRPTWRCICAFLARVSVEWLCPRRLASIFVVRMIYKYFPLVSPRARYLAKGKLSLKWGHESQGCELPACLNKHAHTHTQVCSEMLSSLSHIPLSVDRQN